MQEHKDGKENSKPDKIIGDFYLICLVVSCMRLFPEILSLFNSLHVKHVQHVDINPLGVAAYCQVVSTDLWFADKDLHRRYLFARKFWKEKPDYFTSHSSFSQITNNTKLAFVSFCFFCYICYS